MTTHYCYAKLNSLLQLSTIYSCFGDDMAHMARDKTYKLYSMNLLCYCNHNDFCITEPE